MKLKFGLCAVLLLLAGGLIVRVRSDRSFASSAPPTPSLSSTPPLTTPTIAPTATTAVSPTPESPLPTATFPAQPTEEPPPPAPTPCATEVVARAGSLVHVVGPGSSDQYVVQPFDTVRDACTGAQFDVDPRTNDRLPGSTQPMEGDNPASGPGPTGSVTEVP